MQSSKTLKIANILQVADAIEHHAIAELGFNMATYYEESEWLIDPSLPDELIDKSGHDCGAVACIAGWTVAVLNNTPIPSGDIRGNAMILFGLNDYAADKLFTPNRQTCEKLGQYPYDMDNFQAARTLRHLAVTGEIDFAIGATVNTDQTNADA